ncbi:hypothetical protein C496_19120 [Natronorubrum tibetense GA33]|uniref:Uncharacterized protein n=1 Tax=Natronorubrum tibetense GA33 TaxID=1114856 RepID=L9VL16_9EURY|nr:hypothetical protein [Natronorubrum tibetense]ELY37652.1 hypothetical protein C496_19120 [Natronorubrum tibetense GA33]
MSEGIQSLFAYVIWPYANRMLDTKLGSRLVVDKFQPAIITLPVGIPADFERDTFLVLEVVLLFESFADTELQRTPILIPVELVQVIANETV